MKSPIFLRIASVLTLIHAILHTIGGVFGKPDPGPAQIAVAAMQANRFLVLGSERSYWEFYRGMGLAVTTFLTVEAIVFWLLASLAKKEAVRLRPILAVFAIGYLAFALDSFEYFFLFPVITEILIALCLILAFAMAKPANADH